MSYNSRIICLISYLTIHNRLTFLQCENVGLFSTTHKHAACEQAHEKTVITMVHSKNSLVQNSKFSLHPLFKVTEGLFSNYLYYISVRKWSFASVNISILYVYVKHTQSAQMTRGVFMFLMSTLHLRLRCQLPVKNLGFCAKLS